MKKKVGSIYAFFQRCDNYLYRILAAIHSFNGIVHFSDVKILPMQLSFNLFLNTSYRETNFWSKHLYFQNSIDYIEIRTAIWSLHFFCRQKFLRILSCLEQLLLPSNYSCLQILFLISYSLKINTFSGQLPFRRNLFSRISNYSEHVLFRSWCFFRRATFSLELF